MESHKDIRLVTELLQEQGVEARAGIKVECPKCRHEILSIKSDDLIGTCFNPGCGFTIRARSAEESLEDRFCDVLAEIFDDFHTALLAEKPYALSGAATCAYDWLINSGHRSYHLAAVDRLMLGVIPEKYDIETKFQSLIYSLQTSAEAKEKELSGKEASDKQKKELDQLRQGLEASRSWVQKLSKIVNPHHAGWLCYFYTDARYRIRSIRFRQPYTKKILLFKPWKDTGVFGLTAFDLRKSGGIELPDLLVVEGEGNLLQLQSLHARQCAALDTEPYFLPVIAIGGVKNADFPAIKSICPHPTVCYDNDRDGAGFELVEAGTKWMTVSAFTTPREESQDKTDIDDHIKTFGHDHARAWESVKTLLLKPQLHPRQFEPLAREIDRIRMNQGKGDRRREFEIHKAVTALMTEDMEDRGQFYYDALGAYLFLNSEKKLIDISSESLYYKLLFQQYGLNPVETIFRYSGQGLHLHAHAKGKKAKIYRLSCYRPEIDTLYLTNHGGGIWKITPESIEKVDNGTDGVLFKESANPAPFKLIDRGHFEDRAKNGKFYFEELVLDGLIFGEDRLSQKQSKALILLWTLALYFEDLMPTKPILGSLGDHGSGKSSLIDKIGKTVFGPAFSVAQMSNKPDDFDSAVINQTMVGIDNADSPYKWLEDKLATVATGSDIVRRELFTTASLVRFRASCFLAITSRTPHFKRNDIADRLLPIHLMRLPEQFTATGETTKEIEEMRDYIMSEIVYLLQDVLASLRESKSVRMLSPIRMADFGVFCMKVGKHLGIDVQSLFQQLKRSQNAFTLQDEPIMEALSNWLSGDDTASGKVLTSSELCEELSRYMGKSGKSFAYRGNERAFAQKLGSLKPNLQEFYEITDEPGRSNKRYWSFRLKGEVA